MVGIDIRLISYQDAKPFILNKHYAKRMPNIKWVYGLFINNNLEGICSIGKPASNSLCEGVCGIEYKQYVYELNRLYINKIDTKNILSYFVSQVLKKLKDYDLILVSYADTAMSHCGYIYQATNWIYTGITKERTDKYVSNGNHSRHYNNKYNYLRKVRSSKHRYIYMTGKSKKLYLDNLKYTIQPYPKSLNKRYRITYKLKHKIINKNNGDIYYE